MEHQTIFFKNHKIYKKKILGVDLNKVSEEFFEDIDFFSKGSPSDMAMKPNIRKMNETCFNELKFIYESEINLKIKSGYQNSWFFYAPPKYNVFGDYHTHEVLSNCYKLLTDYVWTFYLKTPNNCRYNEGKLAFKDGNDEFFIDAEEGYIYSFEYNLLHKGVEAPNSQKERLVAVGNITFNYE